MGAFIRAFAVAAVLASAACSEPYGYGAGGYGYGSAYGGAPAYGYGAPAYGYGAPGYGYGGPGYASAPPLFAYGAIINERRDDWRHDDSRHEDWHGDRGSREGEGRRAPDERRGQGSQFGGAQRDQPSRAPPQPHGEHQSTGHRDIAGEIRNQIGR